jgi:lipid II:glycine glycyltransferase (peptidoglycan interpeptide bridge formation enzyme)
MLSSMHPKTRYNIRLAQKHGVIVSEDNSDRAFESYIALMRETTQRQRYYAHDDTYHRRLWKILHTAGIAHLFQASYKGEVLCAWIVFVWKDTVYYPYGASSRMKRDVMAPNLILWEIALWAKSRGIRSFDLWGSLGPDPNTADPWYGFNRFKEGYSPNLVEFIGSYDLVINRPVYEIYKIIDRLRWIYLKLKKF